MTEIKHVESAVEQQASRASENGELTEGEASNLFYSNKVFGGLLTDFRTWRLKKRDILDGLSLKCLGAVFLIYFSLLGFVMTVGKHQENSSGGYLVRILFTVIVNLFVVTSIYTKGSTAFNYLTLELLIIMSTKVEKLSKIV